MHFQVHPLDNNALDDFLMMNNAIKDFDAMYRAMLSSSRTEMSRWVMEINSQFISEVGLTVDRLNDLRFNGTFTCIEILRSEAGTEIQEIVQSVMNDLESYQRDFVFLLLDVTDQYISLNQKWPVSVWSERNTVTQMDLITYQMETYIYNFYKTLFEVQVEEIIIEMQYFDELITETRTRAFNDLRLVGARMETKIEKC